MGKRAFIIIATLLCGVDLRAATGDGSPPGVYKAFDPHPKPIPTPDPSLRHIPFKQGLALSARAGVAVRLGDEGQNQITGNLGGVDLFQSAAPGLAFDYFVEYFQVPYKDPDANRPMIGYGLGAKVMYLPFRFDKVHPFVQGGMGLYNVNRAAIKFAGYDSGNPSLIQHTVEYFQDFGFGFNVGLGVLYEITPRISARFSVDATSVSLGGGNGDSISYLSPTAGLAYTL